MVNKPNISFIYKRLHNVIPFFFLLSKNCLTPFSLFHFDLSTVPGWALKIKVRCVRRKWIRFRFHSKVGLILLIFKHTTADSPTKKYILLGNKKIIKAI